MTRSNTWKFLISSLTALLITSSSYAQNSGPSPQDHYCDDAVSWQEWEELLAKYPEDDKVSSLYAFRVGLCTMVKSGKIDIQRAIRLFERMRAAVLKGIEEDNRKFPKQEG